MVVETIVIQITYLQLHLHLIQVDFCAIKDRHRML